MIRGQGVDNYCCLGVLGVVHDLSRDNRGAFGYAVDGTEPDVLARDIELPVLLGQLLGGHPQDRRDLVQRGNVEHRLRRRRDRLRLFPGVDRLHWIGDTP
ncbi:hypothetical protein [Streptomyces sp. JH34]|uniref:hypothetical protein n=1 Tax=Streptomyces sp. JH34 TaxID=2793633 RepID=UPI0023F842C3|nr:hypothetical protein [Streptomyces sp. JH34]MDF6016910.1 hypothetical protein [Streptomyces sp. JH34]MDF6023128.1 hypothetical protein [Streptomyces sp. JH34]